MLKWIIGILLAPIALLALLLNAPLGDPIPSYKTDKQQFSWGEMYAWMSVRQTDVSGYLLINFNFASSVVGKECILSVNRVLLTAPVRGIDLMDIDDVHTVTATSGVRQINFFGHLFEYNRHGFPYDLEIKLDFDCDGVQQSFTFSEPLEFRMVQPRLAGQ